MILLPRKEFTMTLLMSISLLLIDGGGVGAVNSEQEKSSLLGGVNKKGNLLQDAHVVEYKAQLCVKSDKTGCVPLTINRTANIDVGDMHFFCRRYALEKRGHRSYVDSLHCSGAVMIRDNSRDPVGKEERQVLLTETLKNLTELSDTVGMIALSTMVSIYLLLPAIIFFVATVHLVFPTRPAKIYFSLGFIGLVGFSLWFWGIWKW